MGHQKKLESWILNNLHPPIFQIERMTWISEWFPQCSDFEVSYDLDGNTIRGRGIDRDENIALAKALSELCERAICYEKSKISSNGMATHFDLECAVLNAKKEAIERDAILCHHLTNTPYFSIPLSDDFLGELKINLSKKGYSVVVGEAISAVEGCHVVICQILDKEKTGSFFGFGCSQSLNEAIIHAIHEVMINVSADLNGVYPRNPLSLLDFYKMPFVKGQDHQRVHSSNRLLEIDVIDEILINKPSMKMDDLDFIELFSNKNVFQGIPLRTVQVNSNRLQNIFYGKPSLENINLKRLRQFSNKKIELDDLSSIPHPIG